MWRDSSCGDTIRSTLPGHAVGGAGFRIMPKHGRVGAQKRRRKNTWQNFGDRLLAEYAARLNR